MRTPKSFTSALARMELPSVFNPYADRCLVHDRFDAARVRKRNLIRCLDAALAARVDTIWVARDLGYRGGRRTGIPLTDEAHLRHAGMLMGGIEFERATRGPEVAERTAGVVWDMLARVGELVVLWNIFPFHPHEEGDPFSNRCHRRAEREAVWPFFTALVNMIRPERIVAIGRDAGSALNGIDVHVDIVRHPSYGGQAEFVAGVERIYGISSTDTAGASVEVGFS